MVKFLLVGITFFVKYENYNWIWPCMYKCIERNVVITTICYIYKNKNASKNTWLQKLEDSVGESLNYLLWSIVGILSMIDFSCVTLAKIEMQSYFIQQSIISFKVTLFAVLCLISCKFVNIRNIFKKRYLILYIAASYQLQ